VQLHPKLHTTRARIGRGHRQQPCAVPNLELEGASSNVPPAACPKHACLDHRIDQPRPILPQPRKHVFGNRSLPQYLCTVAQTTCQQSLCCRSTLMFCSVCWREASKNMSLFVCIAWTLLEHSHVMLHVPGLPFLRPSSETLAKQKNTGSCTPSP